MIRISEIFLYMLIYWIVKSYSDDLHDRYFSIWYRPFSYLEQNTSILNFFDPSTWYQDFFELIMTESSCFYFNIYQWLLLNSISKDIKARNTVKIEFTSLLCTLNKNIFELYLTNLVLIIYSETQKKIENRIVDISDTILQMYVFDDTTNIMKSNYDQYHLHVYDIIYTYLSNNSSN